MIPVQVCMLLRSSYPPDIRVRKEATALASAGHEVEVVCPNDGRSPLDSDRGVAIRRVPGLEAVDGPRGLLRAARYLATGVHPGWRREIRAAVSRGADAVHVHDLPLVRTALRVRDAATDPVAVVADLHEHYPAAEAQLRGPVADLDRTDVRTLAGRLLFPVARLRRFERDAVRSADATLAVCEEAREVYCRLGAPPDRVHVVSNTVDLETFDETTDERPAAFRGVERPVVSYVGTLSGVHRGLQTAVDALPRILERHPDTRLFLVGAGSYESRLRDRIADRGLGDRVTFTGWVDVERVPGFMAGSDLGLVPHLATEHTNTTVPHKLFQYMAARTPVVAGDAAPLERIVGETGAGATFRAGDPVSLADAVVDLLDDPERAAACGRRGREAVETTYNWERDAGRLRAVYESV